VDSQNALDSTNPKIIASLLCAITAHAFVALCLWLFLPWPEDLLMQHSNTVITVNTIQSREHNATSIYKRNEKTRQTIGPEKNFSEQNASTESPVSSPLSRASRSTKITTDTVTNTNTNRKEDIAPTTLNNTFGSLPVPKKLL